MYRTVLGVLVAALAVATLAVLGAPAPHAPGPGAAGLVAARGSVRTAAVPVDLARASTACRAGLVALTFDDGPSASVTPTLVHTLLSLKAPATFFMVGSRLRTASAAGRLVARSGFVIGNHSWSHHLFTSMSDAQVLRELRSTRREMRANKIVPSDLVRPPYGGINRRVRADVRSLGLVPVLWTIDSRDWAGGSAQQIAGAVLSHLRPHATNIVLQHDGVTNSPRSVRAVPAIVRTARQRGYCLVPLGPGGRPAVPVPAVRTTVLSGTEDGPTPIRVRLDLDRTTVRPVSLRVQTSDGTAKAGADYQRVSMVVRFPAGVRTAWFSVPVVDDSAHEAVEDVRLTLDQPVGLRITRSQLLASVFSNE